MLIRNTCFGSLLGLFVLIPGGCLNDDAVASMIDITSSTAGNILKFFVQSGIENALFAPGEPDTSLPISQQEH
jgi:hypothetical protein